VSDWCARLHERRRSIARAARRAVDRSVVDRLARQLTRDAPRAIEHATRLVDTFEVRTRAVDPARTLARGWSVTRDADGRIVRSIADVRAGAQLVTTVNDGALRSTVDE
jgi:exodeoxyribonuclease VII large subunit